MTVQENQPKEEKQFDPNLSWTPEYELDYWRGNPEEFYIKYITRKYDIFQVEDMIKKHAKNPLDIVMDIGGGKYAGALYSFKEGKRRILYDLLAERFLNGGEKLNKIPTGVECISGDFRKLPFSDNSVDIIFCWEALDHCNSNEQFISAKGEILRVLSNGGLLFYEHPIRRVASKGHPFVKSKEQLLDWTNIMDVLSLKTVDIGGCDELYVVMRKNLPEQDKERIEKVGPWYQPIDFGPNGKTTSPS